MVLPNEGGRHFLSKVCNFEKTRVCKAVKIQRKCSMAYEICKFAGVMHAIVVADGAMEAKCERESSHRPFLRAQEAEQWRSERPKERQKRAERAKRTLFKALKGQKSDMLDRKF